MSSQCPQQAGSCIFVPLLTVLFIGLKLGGVIDWSWWWVLSPIWISLVVVVAVLFVCFTILYLCGRI